MVTMDFDFARYVAFRKGQVEQRARDGAAYSYVGERKMRRALTSTRPVTIAIEATTRMWKGGARRELLARSQKASDETHPRLWQAARRAGAALGLEAPAVYVPEGDFPAPAAALGTDEDPVVVVRSDLVDRLDDRELVALIGHELGHVQNNQVLYATALFYLRHEAVFFVRWIVQPAVMALASWSRRAEVTCDRAALIAVRDLDTALSAMVKVAMGPAEASDVADVREHLAELARSRRAFSAVTGLFRSYPDLPKRAAALDVFAESALYQKLLDPSRKGGLSTDEVDMKVHDIVRVFA